MIRSTGHQLIKYQYESIHALNPAVGQTLRGREKKWYKSQTHGLGLLYLHRLQQMPQWTLLVEDRDERPRAKHSNFIRTTHLL